MILAGGKYLEIKASLHLFQESILFLGKDENQTQAQDIARRISGAVAGEVFAQVKTYQVPITNSSPSHLHYLPFASRFPVPHFTLAILFTLLLFVFFVCFDVLLGSFARFVGLVVYLLLNREPKIYGSSSAS